MNSVSELHSPFANIGLDEIKRGLLEGQFVPYFQPTVEIRTGHLAGFEILARWEHPERGVIPPDRFIPSAEETGWIDELTRQLLLSAFAAARLIPEALTLSINVSPVQLRHAGLPHLISEAAKVSGFDLHRLVVEVTESALIDNVGTALEVAQELKRLGCRISLDDFGTGYSSLLHLQSLPFDELKVDRSFVKTMTVKRESRKIVAAVIGLGQSLGLRTVAEGIETQEQAEMMLWLGCELGQGYFYGRPRGACDLVAVLSAEWRKLVTHHLSPWKRISATNLDVSPSQRLAQLQAVYDGAPVGLAFIDQNLRYVNLNQRLADMNGAAVEDHLGSKVSAMIPEFFPQVEPYIRRALGGEVISEVEAALPHTGETRLVSYQPARDEAGEVVGVSIAIMDVTARKRTEEALRASERHYRSMVDLNPQMLWVMDPEGRNLDRSPRWDKITGLMKSPNGGHEWLSGVHPDDLQRTMEAIADSRRSGSPIDVSYRTVAEDGTWCWKRSRGSPRFDPAGKIVCWYGSVQDIAAPPALHTPSIQAVADAPLLSSALRGRHTKKPPSREHGDGLSLVTAKAVRPSKKGRTRNSKKRLLALQGMDILDTPAEVEFDDLVELASEICSAPMSLISLLDSERQWFKASVGIDVTETPLSVSFCAHAVRQEGLFVVEDATKDARFKRNPLVLGAPNIRFYAGMPLYADEGVAVGALCVVDTTPRTLSAGQAKALTILGHQVQARLQLRSERKQLIAASTANEELAAILAARNVALSKANLRLERLAITDSLTGLLNRRAFEEEMEAAFSKARRKGTPLCTVVMDIDDFKQRNDHLGHAAGDQVLRHVGKILKRVIRARDSAARIGGEEFALVLPDTTAKQAALIAERLQEILGSANKKFPLLTLSIGIACLDKSTASWSRLFSEADRAMYKAKRAGKNRLVACVSSNVA